MNNEKKARMIAVSLPPLYIERIKDEAKYRDRTMSGQIRSMIEYYWQIQPSNEVNDNEERSK